MATITGANLLQQILTDRQVTIVNQNILAGRLQQMIDRGTAEDFQIAAVLAANAAIKASVTTGNPLAVLTQSVTEAKDKIDDGSGPGPEPIDTFKLTAGKDVATANVFNAERTWTPGGTDQINSLNDDDVLTGTGTNPTLNFEFVRDADIGAGQNTVITPTLKGVETINIKFTGSAGNGVLDLQDAQGVKAINVSRIADNQDATVRNIADAVSDLSITNSHAPNGDVNFTFLAAAVAGTADSVNLKLSNVDVNQVLVQQAGANPNNGFETINLESTGNDNQVSLLVAEDLKTLNIAGNTDLTLGDAAVVLNALGGTLREAQNYTAGLGNVAGSLTTIDASAFTGNLDLTLGGEFQAVPDGLSGGHVALSVTGGSGDDTIRLNDSKVEANDKIDGGEGDNTLVVLGGTTIDAAGTAAAPVANVLNIQNLQVRTGHDAGVVPDVVTINANAFDASLTNIYVRNEGQNLGLSAAEAATVNLNNLTAAQAAAITVAHGTTNNNGVASNVLNVTLKTATGAKDTVAVTLEDGVNTNPRFNLELNAGGNTAATRVENITINDKDTESNTVKLTNFAEHKGADSTITVTGGRATQFLNLDADVNGALSGYGLVENGAEGSFQSALLPNARDNALDSVIANADYRVLNNGANADVRLVAENIAAGDFAGDLIVRLGDITRADGTTSQSITTGAGNDTIIFDAQGVKNAGYTSGDTVAAGAGTDTLVIDGNHNGRVEVQKSEWDKTSGIDVLRLAGNQGVNNVGNDVTVQAKEGGYYVEIDNDFVRQTDTGNGLVIINNDGDLNTNSESDLVLNLRELSATSNVTFVGANGNGGAGISSNRLQVSDNSINAQNRLDGGDTDTLAAYANTAAWNAALLASTAGNNNVLEVFNTAEVSINDLSNVKNFGRIEATNDTAVAQSLKLVLNDTVMNQLVDASHAASATQVERLVVVANSNLNVAGAVQNLNIDAGAVTNAFGLDVLATGNTNNIVATAGDDKVVLLGNYLDNAYLVDEFGVAIDTLGNNVATAKVVTGTLNLGAGNDTLVTYGAINLVGATLVGIENVVALSELILTDKQLADIIAAGGTLTFEGQNDHTLKIIDTGAGVSVDLSKVLLKGKANLTLVKDSTPANAGSATVYSGAIDTSKAGGGVVLPEEREDLSGGGQGGSGGGEAVVREFLSGTIAETVNIKKAAASTTVKTKFAEAGTPATAEVHTITTTGDLAVSDQYTITLPGTLGTVSSGALSAATVDALVAALNGARTPAQQQSATFAKAEEGSLTITYSASLGNVTGEASIAQTHVAGLAVASTVAAAVTGTAEQTTQGVLTVNEVHTIATDGNWQQNDEFTITLADGLGYVASGPITANAGVEALVTQLNAARSTEQQGVTFGTKDGKLTVTYTEALTTADLTAFTQTTVAGNKVATVTGVVSEWASGDGGGQVEVQQIELTGSVAQNDEYTVALEGNTLTVKSGPLGANASINTLVDALNAAILILRSDSGVQAELRLAQLANAEFSVTSSGLLKITYSGDAGNVDNATFTQTKVAGTTAVAEADVTGTAAKTTDRAEGTAEVQSITFTGSIVDGDQFTVTLPGDVEVASGALTLGTNSGVDALATALNTAAAATLAPEVASQVTFSESQGKLLITYSASLGDVTDASIAQTYVAGREVGSTVTATVTGEATVVDGVAEVPGVSSFSSLGMLDTVQNFKVGTDTIAVGASVLSLTRVADVDTSNDLEATLTAAFANIGASQAGLVEVKAGSAAGTYLFANNATAAVSATDDVFIKLVGVEGKIGAVGGLDVTDFFAAPLV